MKTDSHFLIGRTHQNTCMPCQDYALSELLPDGTALAVVSDGCSTGGQTDIGSRIVARSQREAVRAVFRTETEELADFVSAISFFRWRRMAKAAEVLGCAPDDLLATCLYAHYAPHGGFAHIAGDGAVAWKDASGTLVMTRYEWGPDGASAPFYPAYEQDGFSGFVAHYGGDLGAKVLLGERWELPEGSDEPIWISSTGFTLGEGIGGPAVPLPAGLRSVAVFTDGVMQVQGVTWQETVARLMAFKNVGGMFAKRRLSAFSRELGKAGSHFDDDLGYAVILNDSMEE